MIDLQMKGRTFVRLSNLSSSDSSRFDFAEVVVGRAFDYRRIG